MWHSGSFGRSDLNHSVPQELDQFHEGRFGQMAALHGDDVVAVSLDEATAQLKTVRPEWYAVAKAFFG